MLSFLSRVAMSQWRSLPCLQRQWRRPDGRRDPKWSASRSRLPRTASHQAPHLSTPVASFGSCPPAGRCFLEPGLLQTAVITGPKWEFRSAFLIPLHFQAGPASGRHQFMRCKRDLACFEHQRSSSAGLQLPSAGADLLTLTESTRWIAVVASRRPKSIREAIAAMLRGSRSRWNGVTAT